MPYRQRTCNICLQTFMPPHRATVLSTGDNHLRLCAGCRRVEKGVGEDAPSEMPRLHSAAPMRQEVFDLATWGLDRGWGVTLIASFLIHGGEVGPV